MMHALVFLHPPFLVIFLLMLMVISYDVERNVEYLADIRLCVCNSRKTADVLRIFDPVMIPRYRHLDNTYNETQDVLTKTYHVLLF